MSRSKTLQNLRLEGKNIQYSGESEFFKNEINALLTIDDLANYLKVSKKTIYGWIYKGVITPLRVAGNVRFDPSYIKLWISQQQGDS